MKLITHGKCYIYDILALSLVLCEKQILKILSEDAHVGNTTPKARWIYLNSIDKVYYKCYKDGTFQRN